MLQLLIVASASLILAGLLRIPQRNAAVATGRPNDATAQRRPSEVSRSERTRWFPHRRVSAPAPTAEEIVRSTVAQFARSRRDLVRGIARQTQKGVLIEIERFFDALESGVWKEIEAQWKALSARSGQDEGSTHSAELDPFWPAVLDAYGVAEQAHLWPAQKLLDYGNAILASLRSGWFRRLFSFSSFKGSLGNTHFESTGPPPASAWVTPIFELRRYGQVAEIGGRASDRRLVCYRAGVAGTGVGCPKTPL
jgi:hypothetical protein